MSIKNVSPTQKVRAFQAVKVCLLTPIATVLWVAIKAHAIVLAALSLQSMKVPCSAIIGIAVRATCVTWNLLNMWVIWQGNVQ